MDEKCHYTGCEHTAFASCDICGKPTCMEAHSKQIGDKFLCLHCAEKIDKTVEKIT